MQKPVLLIPSQKPQSPIFSLLSPEPRSLAKYCQDGGYVVRPIVPPTVPKGTERVRVCLHAGNTIQDVEGLVGRIGEWLKGTEDFAQQDLKLEFKSAL
jgi:8-amino-7-oxononanoate synthase